MSDVGSQTTHHPTKRDSVSGASSWRTQAAAIVEEILPVAKATHFDALLDLRTALLTAQDWEALLDSFLHARALAEDDHYMPFYRLRQLLQSCLMLEMAGRPDTPHSDMLRDILRRKFPSLARYRRELQRLHFELNVTNQNFDLNFPLSDPTRFQSSV